VSENLDLVRSIYADWERGDWRSATWAHPDIEFVIADGPGGLIAVRGLAEMARNWRQWLDAWHDFRMEAEDFRELDRERVLILHRYAGRAKASGVSLEQVPAKAAIVLHIRDGKVTKLVGYNYRDNALAALGLEE
jgi:ketosteroid isomerase-like protein